MVELKMAEDAVALTPRRISRPVGMTHFDVNDKPTRITQEASPSRNAVCSVKSRSV
jgi:hypothetical protein